MRISSGRHKGVTGYTGLVWTGNGKWVQWTGLSHPDIKAGLVLDGIREGIWYDCGFITCDYRELAADHGVDTVYSLNEWSDDKLIHAVLESSIKALCSRNLFSCGD